MITPIKIAGNNLYNINKSIKEKKPNTNNTSKTPFYQKTTRIPSNIYFGEKIPFSKTINNYFIKSRNIVPDQFQEQAMQHIYDNKDTIVTAPTGTGKTLIAEYAVKRNLEEKKKTYYTVPIKALANDKYNDFVGKYGANNVGIMTGDIKHNTQAPIVIMTTEVYRNMLHPEAEETNYQNHSDLGSVIFDEFHYMNNESRGHVWEEALMYTPTNVQMLALSATVENAKEISDWIKILNPNKKIALVEVPSKNRHVPLTYNIHRFDADTKKNNNNSLETRLQEVINKVIPNLNKKQKLPAIVFAFSRSKCDSLVDVYAEKGKTLLNEDERSRIEKRIEQYESDNEILSESYDLDGLYKGVASHHGGMLPSYKKFVEELFREGLVKVVFATDTLGAGINMPAKTTLITDLHKYDGESLELMPVSEFHQMAGRAGRRGFDKEGNVIVLSNSDECDNLIKKYIKATPEKVLSKYEIDFNFVLSYIKNNSNIKEIDKFLEKSLYVYQSEDKENTTKQLKENFHKAINFLQENNYLEKTSDNSYKLTKKGEIASSVQIGNMFLVTELLTSEVFNELDKKSLAAVASIINVNSDANSETNFLQLGTFIQDTKIESKIEQNLDNIKNIIAKNPDIEFEYSTDRNDEFITYLKSKIKSYPTEKIENFKTKSMQIAGELHQEPDRNEDFSKEINKLNELSIPKAKKEKYRIIRTVVSKLKRKENVPYSKLLLAIALIDEKIKQIEPTPEKKLALLNKKLEKLNKTLEIAKNENSFFNQQALKDLKLRETTSIQGNSEKKQLSAKTLNELSNLIKNISGFRQRNKSFVQKLHKELIAIENQASQVELQIKGIKNTIENKKFLEKQKQKYIELYANNDHRKELKIHYDRQFNNLKDTKILLEKAKLAAEFKDQKFKKDQRNSLEQKRIESFNAINSKINKISAISEEINKMQENCTDLTEEIVLNKVMAEIVYLLLEKHSLTDTEWKILLNKYRKQTDDAFENDLYNGLNQSLQVIKQFRNLSAKLSENETGTKYLDVHNKFDLAVNKLSHILLQISSPIKIE